MLVSVAGDGPNVPSSSVSVSASWLSTGLFELRYADGGRPSFNDALITRNTEQILLILNVFRPHLFFCPVFSEAESPARNDLFFYQLFDSKAHLCANGLNSRIKSSLKSSMKSVGECWFHLQCLCYKTMDYRLFVTGCSFIHRSKLATRSASSHQLAPPFIRGSSSWRCTSGTFLFSFFPLWDLRSIHESKRTITLLLYIWIIPIFLLLNITKISIPVGLTYKMK